MALNIIVVFNWLVLFSAVSSLSVIPQRMGAPEISEPSIEKSIKSISESRNYHYEDFSMINTGNQEHDYNAEDKDQQAGSVIPGLIPKNSLLLSKVADKFIELLIKTIIQGTKAVLKEVEPILVKGQENVTFNEAGYKISCSLNNVAINSTSKLTLPKLTSQALKSGLKFGFQFPVLNTTDTIYELDGRVLGTSISAKGEMRTNTTNLIIDGSLQYGLVKNVLQIKKLKIDYDFSILSVEMTNLVIPRVSKKRVNEIISSMMTSYLKTQEKPISKRISIQIKNMINEIIRSFTTDL